ncbi:MULTISPECIES: hypothetical protein [Streptomyces]|uniref:hypothetical protein n=1 Tax=Streptomyces TaxID=1883 RepID=UPI000AC469CE|nr:MULTISPECIES: hypothetical protein [Streptomyces]MDI5904107.1 hypothetical protein [Streptomyces sp. 12257]
MSTLILLALGRANCSSVLAFLIVLLNARTPLPVCTRCGPQRPVGELRLTM